ncbi:MAG: toxin-antitoxin system YwqK family antitoxin, partial [Chlorobi bacterium]|nr:toxin-antitoxin system YwqK family antitoxin [Chlorobiota bacterium]
EKCINKSKEYIRSYKNEAAPYYYAGISYYKEYSVLKDNFSVKAAAKYLCKGKDKEHHEVYDKKFEKEISDFHNILRTYALNYYQANKKMSKPYFEYLAELYNDTLKQYYDAVIEKDDRPDAEIIKLTKAGKLNRIDDKGLKQGKWMKVYSNGETAYEAHFKDGKPVGELKRYHENGKPAALLIYDEKGDTADARFFDENENLISEGKYVGKDKHGKWIYYKDGIKVKEENYKTGKLHGNQIIFYDNGQIFDKKTYEDGVQNGIWVKYYRNGNVFLKAKVVNDKMEGPMLRYYKNGKIEVKGQYKNDLKDGVWTFYDEKGEKTTITFKNGHDVNEAEVEKRESEEYKKNMEKGKHIADPEDYKDNPYEYPINK